MISIFVAMALPAPAALCHPEPMKAIACTRNRDTPVVRAVTPACHPDPAKARTCAAAGLLARADMPDRDAGGRVQSRGDD
ncbi:hypothetical protein KY084_02825 [Stakelama sp. CBK3Z-3]|uniref:Uncharacterized protein n=1 Tax=Stakelama flava TaxID=2860338 RepID=A0ABS6XHX1_9SPHN|nr:hypothetical protein [Stakelama flava]MBW4329808.1 hypothetical protein [Stakelama flava]